MDKITKGGLLNSLVRITGRSEMAFTNGDGFFTLVINPPIPEGQVHLSIRAEDYEDYLTSVSIDQNLEVALAPLPKVSNPTSCARYDHGLRHFYWTYIYDGQPSHRRKDWYQESPSSWNECYYDGTHNHLKVVQLHANVDGNEGVICKDDSHAARIFIPNLNANGSWPRTLRYQSSEADTWVTLAEIHEIGM
jgi:hypothetical protein